MENHDNEIIKNLREKLERNIECIRSLRTSGLYTRLEAYMLIKYTKKIIKQLDEVSK